MKNSSTNVLAATAAFSSVTTATAGHLQQNLPAVARCRPSAGDSWWGCHCCFHLLCHELCSCLGWLWQHWNRTPCRQARFHGCHLPLQLGCCILPAAQHWNVPSDIAKETHQLQCTSCTLAYSCNTQTAPCITMPWHREPTLPVLGQPTSLRPKQTLVHYVAHLAASFSEMMPLSAPFSLSFSISFSSATNSAAACAISAAASSRATASPTRAHKK